MFWDYFCRVIRMLCLYMLNYLLSHNCWIILNVKLVIHCSLYVSMLYDICYFIVWLTTKNLKYKIYKESFLQFLNTYSIHLHNFSTHALWIYFVIVNEEKLKKRLVKESKSDLFLCGLIAEMQRRRLPVNGKV